MKQHSDPSDAAIGGNPASESKDGSCEVVRDPGIPFIEFVTIIAMIMALNAMAIDVMLPALPAIGDALQIVEENNRQLILLSYLIGFGGGQLFFGPVTDSLGRRKVLVSGLAVYSAASIAAIFAQNLDQLLLARVLRGLAALPQGSPPSPSCVIAIPAGAWERSCRLS